MTETVRNLVLINDHAVDSGGAARVALRQARELARQGCRVHFFAAVGPGTEQLLGVTSPCPGTKDIVENPSRVGAMTQDCGIASRTELGRLRHVESGRHTGPSPQLEQGATSSVVRAAAGRGFGIVCTAHEFFAVCPNGGFFDYPTGVACTRKPLGWSCLTRNCDSRHAVHKLWRVARQVVQQTAGGIPASIGTFICPSKLAREIIEPHLPRTARIVVLPAAVPKPPTPPAPDSERDGLVFVGRLAPAKGPFLYAEASRLAGVPAVFIGDGELRETIRREFPEASLLGWMDTDALHRRIARSLATVFPSIWYETQGLVVYEAAALGVTSIVSTRTAVTEFVTDGVSGLHFQQGSVQSLATAIRRLVSDREAALAMGRAARDAWQRSSLSTEEGVCDQLRELYRDALERHRRSRA
ncbi:MAG: glycosyltransferase family 4 protein [Verrucomicrobiae bacterium]|nr:glycosyltransferase family 4 protein [Verrucomicrobiae bacterium]